MDTTEIAAGPESPGNPTVEQKAEKISVVTLGCPKNLVDSESMLGQLHQAGYPVASNIEDADLVVVNTCGFLNSAQQESIDTILEVSRLKETGKLRKLVVAGCMAQRHGADILDEMEEIDYLLGPGSIDRVVDVAEGLLGARLDRGTDLGSLENPEFEWKPRVLSGSRHTAYLKISEGCNNTCTFCIIPQLRGKHRSRTIEDLVAEAEKMVASGVKEITIVAQDTTSYGLDIYKRFALPELLHALDEVEGISWIRLLYTYPRYWTQELLDVFGDLRHVVPYVDMPIQHASDSVLRRMRRGAGWMATSELLQKIRSAAPEMTLRTTVITGFPGETEEEFRTMMNFLADFEFDNLGAFAYSTEEGTPAGAMEDQVPEEIREARRAELLLQQRTISLRRNRQRIGRTLETLIDSVDRDKGVAYGRWTGQAIEIDGQVILKTGRSVASTVREGDFVEARIVGAGPYDLVAVPDEKPLAKMEV